MPFLINKSYNFSTLAAAILGSSFTLMKVKAILSADEAVKYRDVNTIHTQLKTVIPGLPTNATDLTYILFVNKDDEKIVLAYEWLDSNSVAEVTTINIRADIANATSEDLTLVRTLLLEHGYTNLSLTTF